MPRRLSPLVAVFLTVFLDMLSFGLVIPDIQLRGKALGAEGWINGLMIATFSIAQLLTAPWMGRWSDRAGRRIVLLATTALASVSFLVYANALSLPILFAARVLAGISGANLGVAFAYVADVTTPENRSRGMGLIGAAFGLGFIFGPVTGAWLVAAGGGQPHVLGYTAAFMAAVNCLFIWMLLPESNAPRDQNRPGLIADLKIAFASPELRILLVLFFAANYAFSNLESTFFLLSTEIFLLSQSAAAVVLVFVGIVGAIMQGLVSPRLTPIFGEVRLLRVGYLLQAPPLAILPFASPWWPLLLGALVLGVGSGLAQPSLGSLISQRAPATMQGGVFGVTQALGALARIVGPITANSLYAFKYWTPYALAGIIMLIPIFAAYRVRERRHAGAAAQAEG